MKNTDQNNNQEQTRSQAAKASPLEQYSVQPKQDEDRSPYYKSAAPAIALPKGGGAIKGIDEKFTVNAVNGTASVEIPLPLTGGRGGFSPALSISYNSGGGNGICGLGWNLGLPSIQRKTDKRLPEYDDANESDVFLLAGAEDLIPELDEAGQRLITKEGSYTIKKYRPRIEGLFARIEQISQANSVWWRVTTKDNITTYYGLQTESRIADPKNAARIFQWLPDIVVDHKGNVQQFVYIAENLDNVPDHVYERNRLNGTAACTNTYLKGVRYTNRTPYFIDEAQIWSPELPVTEWMMEAVIDYGDHSGENLLPDQLWACRKDASSDFHAGFEIRTWRKIQRVLMFHRFSDLNEGDATLVRSLELQYKSETQTGQETLEADFIMSAVSKGYKLDNDGSYIAKALPAMTMEYSPLAWDTTIHKVDAASFRGAPQGLTGPYQWTDLEGEGISGILSEQEGNWYYKHNLGNGTFAAPKQVAEKPNFSGLGNGLQWQDLDADGRRQLVDAQLAKGYWQLDGPDAYTEYKSKWEPFRTFEKNINIDWSSPFTKMLDLNGDGRADVLITEDRAWSWWENEGKTGFDFGGNSTVYIDEEKGPSLLLRDAVQSIFLADMNGDGMTDLVRVRNGEVCYWPNMGYGRFGAKVTMSHAPVMAEQDLFNPLYISLSDISGTGAADIIYTDGQQCRAWINHCGNAFSAAVDISPLPATDAMSKLAVMDFLGTGTACLVWSSPLPKYADAPIQYIDLMAGVKPHLLMQYHNGTGKTVSVSYKTSTQYYLLDKQEGIKWATRLPFPVHCIDTVTTYDLVSDSRFAQSYRYRHGYYDHEEREFRGFGYVETVDIETVDHTEGSMDQEPVLTKSWYHTGAWLRGDAIHKAFAREYLAFEGWDTPFADGQSRPIITMPQGMDPLQQREACRALKGSPLRQEIYALPKNELPHIYTATAFAYTVKQVQKAPVTADWLAPKHASFMNMQEQQIAFSCEGNMEDPRIMHQLTLATDEYGHPLEQVQIAYGRKHTDASLPTKVQQEQAKIHLTYSTNAYTGDAKTSEHYRLRVPYEQKAYELRIAAPADDLYTIAELRSAIATTTAIDYSEASTAGTRRLLNHSKTKFLGNNAVTALDFGQLDTLGLGYESYQKAFTAPVLTYGYGDKLGPTMPVTNTTDAIMAEGGYVKMDQCWWVPSGRATYDLPLQHFYTPSGFTDPWNNSTTVTFWDDDDRLLPKKVTDALGNISEVLRYNWYNLQPERMKDANNNISEVLYDALGMAVAMAVKGKDLGTEGDTLTGLELDSAGNLYIDGADDLPNQQSFWNDPDFIAEELLQDATWRCVYDMSSLPVRVGMIASTEHTYGTAVNTPELLIRLSYSDGFGRLIMHKAIADEGQDKEWIGTGRTVYNNKGNAIMQYEPYFSHTHGCDTTEQAEAQGVSAKVFYDPVGRVRETQMPDGTFSRTRWTAWEQEVWDANDTVLESDWYAARISNGLGAAEKEAAEKAAVHANTPTIIHTDSLARGFFTIQQSDATTFIESYEVLDIQGQRIAVVDGRGLQPLQYRYNMLQAPCRQQSMDSGTAYTLLDVAGQPLYTWDAEDRKTSMTYDALRRPLARYLTPDGGATTKPEYWIYGEGQTDDIALNLRGQVYEHFDPSGKQQVVQYDFKGAPLESTQTLLADATITEVNWNSAPALDTEVFTSTVQYDALGRAAKTTDPGGHEHHTVFARSGALQQVKLDGAVYVQDVVYDAKGQRQAIWYGNDTKTSYTYDPLTYSLRRLLTVDLGNNTILQDLNYVYDPSGNITRITDAAQQDLFFENTVVSPDQVFTYDALYRLIKAEGREQKVNTAPGVSDIFDDAPWKTHHKGNGGGVQRYTQYYTYDEVGNIERLQHVANEGSYTRTFEYNEEDNRLVSTTAGNVPNTNTYSYTHDVRGNMTSMTHLNSMNWNSHNELASIVKGSDTTHYQYASGQRIRKHTVKGSLTEVRIYLGDYEIYRKFDTSTGSGLSGSLISKRETLHISDDAGRIAMREIDLPKYTGDTDLEDPLTRYIYSNHLQSASLELDEDGDIISYEEYHPYGTTAYQAVNQSITATAKRYRYTGKERDEESGLYYHGARYYIPWLCRWTAVDPLEAKYAGMSPYNYAFNNPVIFNDPSGMEGEEVHIGSWIRTAEGAVKYNSGVTNLESAIDIYGDGAEIWQPGHSYKSRSGNDIVLGVNGKFTRNGNEIQAPDEKETFWEGIGASLYKGINQFVYDYYNDPSTAGYGSGLKLDGSKFTVEDVKRYETNWSEVLDPEHHIKAFSHNTVYGISGFFGGLANGDGRKTAQSVPKLLSAAGTIGLFKGMGRPFSNTLTGSGDLVTIYRGINSETGGLAYTNALNGVVESRGNWLFGHSNALKHNSGLNGTVSSRFTSWTTNIDVALNYAYRTNGEGVLLKMEVPKSLLIESPNLKNINLFHKQGIIVSESEWLLKGKVKNINSQKVNLSWKYPN